MALPATLQGRLSVPVVAAPMFLVSGPELVLAACRAGIGGSFPAPNARTIDVFESWLARISDELAYLERTQSAGCTPVWAVNLVVHHTNERYPGDLELCIEHEVSVILTSNPAETCG